MFTMSTTHYDTLEISRTASTEAIKANYRRLMRKHHPDHGGNNPELAGRINEAYETLSNTNSRASYDAKLAAEEVPTQATGNPPSSPHTGQPENNWTFIPTASAPQYAPRPNPYPTVLPHHARPEDYFLDDNLRRSVRIERTAGSFLRYAAHAIVLTVFMFMLFIVLAVCTYLMPPETAAVATPAVNMVGLIVIGGYITLIIRGHLKREKKRAAHNAMFGAR